MCNHVADIPNNRVSVIIFNSNHAYRALDAQIRMLNITSNQTESTPNKEAYTQIKTWIDLRHSYFSSWAGCFNSGRVECGVLSVAFCVAFVKPTTHLERTTNHTHTQTRTHHHTLNQHFNAIHIIYSNRKDRNQAVSARCWSSHVVTLSMNPLKMRMRATHDRPNQCDRAENPRRHALKLYSDGIHGHRIRAWLARGGYKRRRWRRRLQQRWRRRTTTSTQTKSVNVFRIVFCPVAGIQRITCCVALGHNTLCSCGRKHTLGYYSHCTRTHTHTHHVFIMCINIGIEHFVRILTAAKCNCLPAFVSNVSIGIMQLVCLMCVCWLR